MALLHPTKISALASTFLGMSLLMMLRSASHAPVNANSTRDALTPLVLAFSSTSGDWSHRFNPFASGLYVDGAVYENLYVVSIHDNARQYPMLATYYRWSADLKTLTFTIRQGVRWSDGQPLTAEDVLFTIMLGKACTICDTAGLWEHTSAPFLHVILPKLASVAERGNTVSLTFTKADTSIFASLVNSLWIVPKHIWAGRTNPATWTNDHPVGTGPFTQVENVTGRSFDLARNPHYWQRGEPRIRAFRAVFYNDKPCLTVISKRVGSTGARSSLRT